MHIAILILFAAALGQQPCAGGAPAKNAPDCVPIEKLITPTSATAKITGAGSLHCKDNQHVEGDGRSEAGNHCVDDTFAPSAVIGIRRPCPVGQYLLSNGKCHTPPAKPALKCDRYQHVFHWPGQCGPEPCDDFTCASVCHTPPPDRCVDDTHEVTERQWQQLMKRLNSLEKKSAHGAK